MAPQDQTVDVAVVGAGPGGLACAAAIMTALGPEARVKVYESYPKFRPQGSGVLMMPNVQYALEAISPDLFARFKSHGLTLGPGMAYDEQGNKYEVVAPAVHSDEKDRAAARQNLGQKYGKAGFVLGWHEIRQLLYQSLPEGVVMFDRQVSHYEESSDGIKLHFDRGHPAVHAKLLIGADGYFSKIRQQCLNDGPPEFADRVMWRARIGWQEGMPDGVTEAFRTYRAPGYWTVKAQSAMLFQIGTLEETKHQSWTWVLGCSPERVKEAGVEFDPNARGVKSIQGDASSGSALENVIKVFSNFCPAIMDIVKSTDPSTVTQHGLYMRPLGGSAAFPAPSPTPASAPQTPPQTRPHTPAQIPAKPSCSPANPDTESDQHQASPNADSKRTPKAAPTDSPNEVGSASTTGFGVDHANDIKVDTSNDLATDSTTDLISSPKSETKTDSEINPKTETTADLKHSPKSSQSNSAEGVEGSKPLAGGWGRGRVSMLGDAAHATIPNGQGLALAIEDAVVLAWHLRRQGIAQSALRSYEREMLPRVKIIHAKGHDQSSLEDKERYIYKPTFRPLWRAEDDASATTCIKDFEP